MVVTGGAGLDLAGARHELTLGLKRHRDALRAAQSEGREKRRRARRRERNKRRRAGRQEREHSMLTRGKVSKIMDEEISRPLRPAERLGLAEIKGVGVCSGCGQTKDVAEFFKSTRLRECIECVYAKYNSRTQEEAFDQMIKNTRSRARVKGIDCDLTADDLKRLFERQGGRCGYTHRELELFTKKSRKSRDEVNQDGRVLDCYHNSRKASIDRIDPSKGYTRDNVHFVALHVNLAKLDLYEADFISMCRDVVSVARKRARQAGLQGLYGAPVPLAGERAGERAVERESELESEQVSV